MDEVYLNAELEKCGLRQFKEEFEKVAEYFFEDAEADEFTKKLGKHILESSLFAHLDLKSASDVAANATEDGKNARKKSILRKIFLPTEQMKFLFPILKKAVWLLPIFHVVRWVQVLFTRPQAIGQLKKMNNVEENELAYMKEIRGRLGINHL